MSESNLEIRIHAKDEASKTLDGKSYDRKTAKKLLKFIDRVSIVLPSKTLKID